MENKPVNRITLLNITFFMEAMLLLIATCWSYFSGIELIKHLHLDFRNALIGCASGVGMALIGYLLFAISRSNDMFAQIREIVEDTLRPLVADLRLIDLLILAVVSGFCEEVFFRGVVQEQFNPVVASLIFGIFHDPTFKHFAYTIIAFLYGLLLGALYVVTENLWVPIIAHTVHNLISLVILRYNVKPPAAPA